MSTKPKDGGPAFPVADFHPGMTLRDYFAAHALIGVLADRRYAEAANESVCAHEIARYCGVIADSMLAERDRPL